MAFLVDETQEPQHSHRDGNERVVDVPRVSNRDLEEQASRLVLCESHDRSVISLRR